MHSSGPSSRDPSDNLVRLVYADWLDEVGEADRAALIRVQIDLASAPSAELAAAEQRLLGPVEDQGLAAAAEMGTPARCSGTMARRRRRMGVVPRLPGSVSLPVCPLGRTRRSLAAARPVRQVVLIDRDPLGSPPTPHGQKWTWFARRLGVGFSAARIFLAFAAPVRSPRAARFRLRDVRSRPGLSAAHDAVAAVSDACLDLVTRVKYSAAMAE